MNANQNHNSTRLRCFRCDGTGSVCNTCGESEAACQCYGGEMDLRDCPDCDGTGVVTPTIR
jgi:hypothetical protein